jgi:hypothetical protein
VTDVGALRHQPLAVCRHPSSEVCNG